MFHPAGVGATATQDPLACHARPAPLTTGGTVTGTRSLRVDASPDLDPDDAFVARLALAARYSPRPVRRAHRFGSGRLLLATAGIAVVTTGGAYAAGVLGPLGPIGPLGPDTSRLRTTRSRPRPRARPRGPSRCRPPRRATGSRASRRGQAVRPQEGVGKPTGKPTGQPSGVPSGGPSGHPTHPTRSLTRRRSLTPRPSRTPRASPRTSRPASPRTSPAASPRTSRPASPPTSPAGSPPTSPAASPGQADRQARREAVDRHRAVRVVTGAVSHGS